MDSVKLGSTGINVSPIGIGLSEIGQVKLEVSEVSSILNTAIDGGINFQNSIDAKNAGANILVSGSTIFNENNGDLKKNISLLRTN